MYIICNRVQRQVQCQKNRRFEYVTRLGSLSGNHGSTARRRWKGHRSLFFTLYTSGIFLSHAYAISLRIPHSIPAFIHVTTQYISDPMHCYHVRTHTYLPITSSPCATQSNPKDKKNLVLTPTPFPPRCPEMNYMCAH